MWSWLTQLSWQEVVAFCTFVAGVGYVLRKAYRRRWPPIDREEFLRVRKAQKGLRALLSRLAYRLPDYHRARGADSLGVPLLCHSGWIPDAPIPLGDPGPSFQDQPDRLTMEYRGGGHGDGWSSDRSRMRRIARRILPREADGHLHEAIREFERPKRLTSDPCYALQEPRREGERRVFTFGLAPYFDYIDVGEALAYEFAMAYKRFGGSDEQDPKTYTPPPGLVRALSMRRSAGAWHEVDRRPSLTGINCLTIITHEDGPTFAMMDRQHVESAQNTLHVVPAGEFQPTQSIQAEAKRQCRLWQTLLREFAEELLDMPEAEGNESSFERLARRPAIVAMRELVASGVIKAWFLGWGLDPLTLKPEFLVTLSLPRSALDGLRMLVSGQGGLPGKNSEGKVYLGQDDWGDALSREALEEMADDPRTLPAGIGCLRLAARHLDYLLAGSPT